MGGREGMGGVTPSSILPDVDNWFASPQTNYIGCKGSSVFESLPSLKDPQEQAKGVGACSPSQTRELFSM